MTKAAWSIAALSLLASACGGGHGGAHANLPPPVPLIKSALRDGVPVLREPEDRNPDPRILEVELRATIGEVEYLEGKRSAVWT